MLRVGLVRDEVRVIVDQDCASRGNREIAGRLGSPQSPVRASETEPRGGATRDVIPPPDPNRRWTSLKRVVWLADPYGSTYSIYEPTHRRSHMSTAPLTEVRDKLREIIDDVVSTGNECVITRHGRPVAVVISHDEYEALVETLNILSDRDAMDAIAEAEGETPEDA